MRIQHVVAGLLLLASFASTGQAQKEKQKPPRRDRNVIKAEEAQGNPAQNAYDLIHALRPSWLMSRGPTTITRGEVGVAVYVDGVKRGSTDELRLINTDQIGELRYLSAGDATMRFGTDHPSGAIEVITKR